MRSHWATYRPGERRGSALPGLDIRPAEFADCADIAAIAHERDGVPLAEAQTRCESDVVHADRLLLVATVGGELAAFGRAARWQRPSDAPNDVAPDGWYLLGVVVRNRWRRRGIGLELTRQR